jgi:hypothetical protein
LPRRRGWQRRSRGRSAGRGRARGGWVCCSF